MKIFNDSDLQTLQNIDDDVVFTVGNFDGLHEGHKHLIHEVLAHGEKNRKKTGIITFEKHPKIGKNFIGHLSCKAEKEAYFKSVGFDFVLFLNFEKIKSVEFDTFIYYLYDNFHLRALILGKDNRIGKDGKGDIKNLKRVFDSIVEFIEIDFIKFDSKKISSSSLRELVFQGDVKRVIHLLQEPYKIICYQERGRGVGREMGTPTLNLKPFDEYKIIPKDGVYAATVTLDNGKEYIGACNIGYKPTFDCDDRTVEVHVLDKNVELVSKKFTIKFLEFIREEKKFSSVEELKINIKKDIDKIRRITGGNSNECY